MIWLYRLLFPFALVVASPYYLLRMARRGGYRRGFWERLGSPPPVPPRRPGVPRVWLQAVSVGEVLAVGPVLRKLMQEQVEVVLTTTTSTGHKLAREQYSKLVLAVAYFPLDWLPFSAASWRRFQPDLAIITEGERWPEHLRQAHARGVPVLCINARLSDRSFRRLSRFPAAGAFVAGGLTRLLASSAQDAERFRRLGYPADRIEVTGNIKFDVEIALLEPEARERLRRDLGLPAQGAVLLGSSTWPGEEEALVAALKAIRQRGIACSLLLVPRHAERRSEVVRVLDASGYSYHLRSTGPAAHAVDVAVGDTTGELRAFTQLCDLVFVGKSLPPHSEGQTPVEAAALGKPLLLGPGMANFRAITQDLLGRGAARQISSAGELAEAAAQLLSKPHELEVLAGASRRWHGENKGGVDRTLVSIRQLLAIRR